MKNVDEEFLIKKDTGNINKYNMNMNVINPYSPIGK
jgi:hypothetical protein